MGGSYNYSKGNGNGNGSSRGRAYGLMLVMAFGAALFGVMVLHKLRERRIFNLLLKEKDTDLISLHLLLQKERDYTKELRRKNEEMKTELYSTRNEKMVLDRRTLGLKSTVGSLKEELQTMEAALEEKQNEIKMLRVNTEHENPQVVDLEESLKEKEAEIEDLKHRLENPVKLWSVSTDDPSNPSVNLTSESVARTEKTEVPGKTKEADRLKGSTGNKDIEKTRPGEVGSGNKSISLRQGETTGEVEDRIGNGGVETDRREMIAKQSEKLDNFEDGSIEHGGSNQEGQGKKGEDSKDDKDGANAADANTDTSGRDIDHKVNDGEVGKGQKLRATPKGGMKMEIQDTSDQSEWSRERGKPGYTGGGKRKKWRSIARTRRLENRGNFKNIVSTVRGRRFFKGDQIGFMGRDEAAALNRRLTGDTGKHSELQNPENTGDLRNKHAHVDTSDANGKSNGITNNDQKQKLEVGKSEDHEAINIEQQNINTRDIKKPENDAEQMKPADPQDLPEDLEVAEAEDQEKDATEDPTDSNFFDESDSNLEEDKEEYREEIDESEF